MMIFSIFYNFLKIRFFADKNVHIAANGINNKHPVNFEQNEFSGHNFQSWARATQSDPILRPKIFACHITVQYCIETGHSIRTPAGK